MKPRIVVVGGGLAGLEAAVQLQARGVGDVVVLEARERCGGRLVSERAGPDADAAADADAFDLGATWFWPAIQPALAAHVAALGLATFDQFDAGEMLIERAATAPAMRVAGWPSAPPAHRVVGGMAALVAALAQRLPAHGLHRGTVVQALQHEGERVRVLAVQADGQRLALEATQVLLALPPRLAAATITFTPALPDAVLRQWSQVPTWMAPHAKYLAVYPRPFWREQGLSGAARSAAGPLGEIHDASGTGPAGALFGFVGLPAAQRAQLPAGALAAQCRAQLVRLFGPQAAQPQFEAVKDWAADGFTATRADWHDGGHAHAPPATVAAGPWRGRLVGVASEWSPDFPGYVAGAVDAARRGVAQLDAWQRAAIA